MEKTNKGLVSYAKAQIGKPYWYGCFGQLSSKSLFEQKKKQYPHYYTATDFDSQYGKKVHDCIGLIKGYLWSQSNEDGNPKYASNGCPDINEIGMYTNSKEKGPISTIPEIPGILVYKEGHIGIYIGNGYCIEAKGHAYGVVKTKLNERGWLKWSKCPYIKYENTTTSTQTDKKKYTGVFPSLPQKGCITKGDKSSQVKLLQKFLNWYGNYNLQIDGKCGPLTVNAIRSYQKSEGLKVDGKFGPASLKKAKEIKK